MQKIKKFFLFSRLFLIRPFKFTPKAARYGVKAAKAGVKVGIKVAKVPLKIIARNHDKIVLEIRTPDLKKMLTASAKKIVAHQEEINRINVFPVADKDTGYNLAATLLGVEGAISQREHNKIFDLSQDIKEGAIINARGNAGMIFTGYLLKFLDEIKNFDAIGGRTLAKAMVKGSKAAYFSILKPVEGTILDTMTAAGNEAYTASRDGEKNIIKILEKSLKSSQKALEETKNKLEVLKQNDVIDAGGLGFVKILEAWLESLKDVTPSPAPILSSVEFKEIFQEPSSKEPLKFRYCFQFSFKKDNQNLDWLREKIKNLGDSVEILESEGIVKVHVHTNGPENLKEQFLHLPEFRYRIEDMLLQVREIEKKQLGLVVSETADLPQEFLEKYKIKRISFKAKFPDGQILDKDNIYQKLKEALKNNCPLPASSVPAFGEFLSVYREALKEFEKILVIILSSKLSGAYSAARIARSLHEDKKRIMVFDCFSAEVGESLVAVRAQEMISRGKKFEEVLDELKSFCPKVKVFGIISDFRYVAMSNRIRVPYFVFEIMAFAQKIGLKILFKIEKGKVGFAGIRLGKNRGQILAEEIKRQGNNQQISVVISHAEFLEEAQALKTELEKNEKIKVLFISQVSPVSGLYAGPGTLIAASAPF